MTMTEDQKNRVYEHRNHIVSVYYERLNFFLVFESILLGVFGILYSKNSPQIPLLLIIAILGFCITIAWSYSQIRLEIIVEDLTKWTKELIPEYKAITEREPKEILPFLSWRLLTPGVPVLVLLIWVALLLFVIHSL